MALLKIQHKTQVNAEMFIEHTLFHENRPTGGLIPLVPTTCYDKKCDNFKTQCICVTLICAIYSHLPKKLWFQHEINLSNIIHQLACNQCSYR